MWTCNSRRLSTSFLAVALAFAVLGAAPLARAATVVSLPGTSARVVTATAADGPALKSLILSLRPGDQLLLAPGTYNIGYVRIYGPAYTGTFTGTPAAPITIGAADPGHRPLLVGGLQIWGASYWKLRNVRIRAAGASLVALNLYGGVGWQVTGSEFYGARLTNAITNVFIGGSNGLPRGFLFANNCVHDAALGAPSVHTNHNIYVNYAGSGLAGGTITRNVIYGAPNGVGIKIGAGGAASAIGPSGLQVLNNTIVLSGRQVLFTGNVRNNRVYGNLFFGALTPLSGDPRTMQVYSNLLTGSNNWLDHNYGYGSTMMLWDPAHAIRAFANAFSNAPAANPVLRGGLSCVGLVPSNPLAARYGARA